MSAEIAPLGFEIDTSPLVTAQKAAEQTAASLDKMGVAAEKATTKSKQAAQGAEAMANAVKNAGTAAGAAAGGMGKFGQETEKAGKGAGAAGLNIKQLLELLKQSQGHAAGSGQAIQNLTGQLGAMAQTIGSGGSGALTGGLTSSIGLLGRLATTLGPIGGLVAGVAGGVAALGAGYVGLSATLAAVQDRFALYEARLKNVYGSAETAKSVFASITVLADKNAVSIDQAAEAYLRLARNNEAIGLTRKQMLDLTDSVQMLGRVSGASTGELASGMLQFSQALASGRLNGDELRSIMENMPALAKAIADGMKISVGQLRAMGAEGQLTGDKITKALLGQLPAIQKEFDGLPVTTEQAFTRVDNAWNKMLDRMGTTLNSSGFMQALAKQTQGMIETFDAAVNGETYEQKTEHLRSMAKSTPAPMARGGTNALLSREQASVALSQMQSNAFAEAESGRARAEAQALEDQKLQPGSRWKQGLSVLQEIDPVQKRVKELTQNLSQLQKMWADFQKDPKLLPEGAEEQAARLPRLIAQMKAQLEDALPAFEAYKKTTADSITDAGKYGYAGAGFGEEVRKLMKGGIGQDEASAAVTEKRIFATNAQTDSIAKQIEAEKARAAAIGQGKDAEREAEAATKAHQWQLEQFGETVDGKAKTAVEAYKQQLIDLAKAQDAAASKQMLLNAQIDQAAAKAGATALAAGGGSGAVSAAERNARRAEELRQADTAQREALTAKYAAEDAARKNSEDAQLRQSRITADTQRRLAGGMSPADARRAQQEQEARSFSEGFSPAQQEIAYQTKLSELRAKDAATIRQQLDEKQRSAALTQKEIELTAKGGLAAQVAIARERELNAIKAAGLPITEKEIALRLKLAEQAVLDADALSKAQRTANAYVQMWQDAGQAITGGLEQQFSKMLDGEKFKMKDFLEQIAKDIAMAVIRAQIIAPISNMFSDIGNGSLGSGGGGSIIGSIVSAVTKSVGSKTAPASAPAVSPYAANDNGAASATRSITFPGGGSFATVGNFVARGADKVDPRLVDILQTASERGGFKAEAYSGYRPGDPRFHGKGMATDVRLFDESGKLIPNYQNASSFRSYEEFAQNARMVQMEKYPELANQFRWGGYFSGPKGKYGAADLMHFDLGGDRVGMGGGSWEGGLTPAQRRLFPGAESHGIGSLISKWTSDMKAANTDIAKAMPKQFEPSLKDVGASLAKSIDAKPIQSLAPALSQVAKNAASAAPALDGVGNSLGSILAQLLQTGLSALFGHAHGGVISGGHSVAFASGGIVNRPTVFPMARGAGLMGEAGPEAILPLKRGPDGKLGVGAGAGGVGDGTQVIINDMRSGGQQVEQQQERGPDGKRLIRLTIRDEVKSQMKNGVYDPEMRSQYGAGRVLARR